MVVRGAASVELHHRERHRVLRCVVVLTSRVVYYTIRASQGHSTSREATLVPGIPGIEWGSNHWSLDTRDDTSNAPIWDPPAQGPTYYHSTCAHACNVLRPIVGITP